MVSKIEWTEETWNPVIGCTKVSAGCKYCYAETMAKRLQAMGNIDYLDGFKVKMLGARLERPLKKKKATMYFVNSMSDLFHGNVSDNFIEKVFSTIEKTPQHKYQILTKRAGRLKSLLAKRKKEVPDNVWLGVTVENKKHGVPRINLLRHIPCRVRFLSVEPLIEDLGTLDLSGIHWVIVGGESGAKARPMREEWALSIKEQCDEQGVSFFFKQWGTWGADMKKRSKHANGRVLAGRTWDEMPV